MTNRIKAGNNFTGMGNISGEFGDNCTVIGPTHGTNTILTEPGAYGTGAKAGPRSIAFGAGANAGVNISNSFEMIELGKIISNQGNDEMKTYFNLLNEELSKQNPEKTRVNIFWDKVKEAATLNGALGLINKIGELIS